MLWTLGMVLSRPGQLARTNRGCSSVLTDAGFEVRTVAGTGHCAHRVHRDNLNGFLSTLAGWI